MSYILDGVAVFGDVVELASYNRPYGPTQL